MNPKEYLEKIDKIENILPSDFDYKAYLKYNPDLEQEGINTEELLKKHYLVFGISENRMYKKWSLIDGNIDIDFDPIFYMSEYPDVAQYYKNASHITQKEKLFHHYINYGKQEGRFKNKIEQEKSLIDINFSIAEIIGVDELLCPKNNLECVCLLTTYKELSNGKLQRFIDHLVDQTTPNSIIKTIDFKIIFNRYTNKNKTKINLSKLKQIFASVDIISLNLSQTEDLYAQSLNQVSILPKYGLKSGPNNMFFQTIEKNVLYNTTLLLETDCILADNWIDSLYWYVKYANGFLVSGAIYDGTVFTKAGSAMMNHINGGTGIYATNNILLQKIIKLLKEFLARQINYNMPGLAYDYGLKLLIDHNINNTFNNTNEREIWQFINRNYLPCKLIINCSTDSFSTVDVDSLIKKYNYSILHIKN